MWRRGSTRYTFQVFEINVMMKLFRYCVTDEMHQIRIQTKDFEKFLDKKSSNPRRISKLQKKPAGHCSEHLVLKKQSLQPIGFYVFSLRIRCTAFFNSGSCVTTSFWLVPFPGQTCITELEQARKTSELMQDWATMT